MILKIRCILATSSFPLFLGKSSRISLGVFSVLAPWVLSVIYWLKCFALCVHDFLSLAQELSIKITGPCCLSGMVFSTADVEGGTKAFVPVESWDNLGWKGPLQSPICTACRGQGHHGSCCVRGAVSQCWVSLDAVCCRCWRVPLGVAPVPL